MNYKESKKILKEIKKAKKILITCHHSPDPDSISSVLALSIVLKKMGKDVHAISPSKISEYIRVLPFANTIQAINYKDFDFSEYDLFLIPDSSSWDQVVGTKTIKMMEIFSIAIDHHDYHSPYCGIDLVDKSASSVAEMLYLIFEDWGAKIDKNTATLLFAGIIGDTGAFQYDSTKPRTLRVAANLMDKGADHKNIILYSFRNYDIEMMKLWGEFLNNLNVDKKHKFVWVALKHSQYLKYKNVTKGKSLAASIFARSIKDTDFGIVMTEDSIGTLNVSLRERNGFSVLKIAKELGGGGHNSAAGITMENIEFNEAVEKVLKTARKFARENK